MKSLQNGKSKQNYFNFIKGNFAISRLTQAFSDFCFLDGLNPEISLPRFNTFACKLPSPFSYEFAINVLSKVFLVIRNFRKMQMCVHNMKLLVLFMRKD